MEYCTVMSKFLIVNGAESIGGFGLSIPDTFIIELAKGDSDGA